MSNSSSACDDGFDGESIFRLPCDNAGGAFCGDGAAELGMNCGAGSLRGRCSWSPLPLISSSLSWTVPLMRSNNEGERFLFAFGCDGGVSLRPGAVDDGFAVTIGDVVIPAGVLDCACVWVCGTCAAPKLLICGASTPIASTGFGGMNESL